MTESCRKAFPDIWEWSGGTQGCLGYLSRFREFSGGPPVFPAVVGWPSRMSGSGHEALPDVREW